MLYSHPMNARTVPWVTNGNIDTHTHIKLENLIGFSGSILESPKIVIFNLIFMVSNIEIFQNF